MKCNKKLKKRKQLLTGRDLSSWAMLLPAIILLFFIVWRPMVQGISLSFFDMKGYTPTKFVGFENYKEVFSDYLFLKTLKNTFLYTFWSLIIGFLPPLIIAILLNEIMHGREFFKFSAYIPVMIPGMAASLIWTFLYQPGENGVLNIFLGKMGIPPQQWLQNGKYTIMLIVLYMTWRGFGTTTILYLSGLQGINKDLYEAATIDGASTWCKIKHVMLPQLKGLMLLMMIRQIITIFQIMEEPLAMTGGGPDNSSLSLGLQGYNYAFVYFQNGRALALGVVTFVILMVFTVIYHKVDNSYAE